jgi:hypothetical protein
LNRAKHARGVDVHTGYPSELLNVQIRESQHADFLPFLLKQGCRSSNGTSHGVGSRMLPGRLFIRQSVGERTEICDPVLDRILKKLT